MAEHPRRLVSVFAHEGQRADALVVEAEVLGERAGDEERCLAFRKRANARDVLVQSIAEALIRRVEQREEAARRLNLSE